LKRLKKGRIACLIAGAVLFALGLCSLFIRTPYLVLTNAEANRHLYAIPFHEGNYFSVSHIHSLHQSPVTEIYTIRDGQIFLVALEFESFGAGLPEVLEPGQVLTRLEAGGLRIDGFKRPIADLRYLIGHVAEHTLHIADRHVPLQTLDRPGQSVQFTPRQLNLWQRLYFNR